MISKMEIWLKCGKDSIQLPILPASYNVTRDAGHETVNVQNLGDVTILGKRGLSSIELESFFCVTVKINPLLCRGREEL